MSWNSVHSVNNSSNGTMLIKLHDNFQLLATITVITLCLFFTFIETAFAKLSDFLFFFNAKAGKRMNAWIKSCLWINSPWHWLLHKHRHMEASVFLSVFSLLCLFAVQRTSAESLSDRLLKARAEEFSFNGDWYWIDYYVQIKYVAVYRCRVAMWVAEALFHSNSLARNWISFLSAFRTNCPRI